MYFRRTIILMTGFKVFKHCRELRVLLLLLRNDMKESMIPHRTKLRELIVEAWKRYFQTLTEDFTVCLSA